MFSHPQVSDLDAIISGVSCGGLMAGICVAARVRVASLELIQTSDSDNSEPGCLIHKSSTSPSLTYVLSTCVFGAAYIFGHSCAFFRT